MINQEYTEPPSRVAFEGERGAGKTTVAKIVMQRLVDEGTLCVMNRDLDLGKASSPHHQQSLYFHRLWEESVTRGDDPYNAEIYARTKFEHALGQIAQEEIIYEDLTSGGRVLMCDRDIDSVVLYAAVEIIIANPHRYESSEARSSLIHELWGRVIHTRSLPDMTFCLISHQPQATLERSYLSKQQTAAQFELSPIQQQSQELATELIEDVISLRPHEEETQIYVISVDGKRPDEIASVTWNILRNRHVLQLADVTYPTIPLRMSEAHIPTTLDELIYSLYNSMSGSAFPSSSEIRLGFSNCVYANSSLVSWAQELELGDLIFTSVVQDERTQTNPVHWVVFERLTDISGRVIDLTPFHEPITGEVVSYEQHGDQVIIRNPSDNTPYSLLRVDDPARAIDLMETAYISQQRPVTETMIAETRDIVFSSQQEEYRVFAGIRLIRMYENSGQDENAILMLRSLIVTYPNNLLTIRELGRLHQLYRLDVSEFSDQIEAAYSKITMAAGNMNGDESANLYNYYAWIVAMKPSHI